MLMGGSVVTSCCLFVLLSTCGICPGLCARERGQQNQTIFFRCVRTKQAQYKETREIVLSTPAGKKILESTPRVLQCSDRAYTSTTGSGRPSCVNSLLTKSARTKREVRKRTKISQIYVYIYSHRYVVRTRTRYIPGVYNKSTHTADVLRK